MGKLEARISAAQEREVKTREGNFPGRGNCPAEAFTEMKLSVDSQAQEEKIRRGAQRRNLRCWGLPSDGGRSPRKARPTPLPELPFHHGLRTHPPREPGRDPAGLVQGKKGPGPRLCGPRGEGLVCREA